MTKRSQVYNLKFGDAFKWDRKTFVVLPKDLEIRPNAFKVSALALEDLVNRKNTRPTVHYYFSDCIVDCVHLDLTPYFRMLEISLLKCRYFDRTAVSGIFFGLDMSLLNLKYANKNNV